MVHLNRYILFFLAFAITKCRILQLKDFRIMLDKERKRLWTTYVRKLHKNCLGKIETFPSCLTTHNQHTYNCLCPEISCMKANDLNEENCISERFPNDNNNENKFIIFDGSPEYTTDNDKTGIRDLNQVVGYINSSYDMMYHLFSVKTSFLYERWELTWVLELNSLNQLFQWNFTLANVDLAYSIPDCLTEHVAFRYHRFFSYIHEKIELVLWETSSHKYLSNGIKL